MSEPPSTLSRHQIYYRKHQARILKTAELRRKADPAAHNEKCRRSKHKNWDANLAKKIEPDRASRLRLKTAAIAVLGGCCAKCGYSDSIHALQIDHVNSDGSVERKTGISNYRLYNQIIRSGTQGRYQCLCANCNLIKRFDMKEYAKGRKRTLILAPEVLAA